MKLTVKTLIFVIATALAACSADDDTPIGGGVDNPVDSHLLPIKLAVGDAPQTRAADGLLKDNFPSGTDITVVIDGNDYSYKTNEPGKELTCTNNPIPYYAISGKSVSIKAFYPALQGWYNRTTTWGWSVNADQTSDDSYKWSDKMYATVPSSYSGLDSDGKVTPTKNVVPLKFYHLMAKVQLTITTPDANTKIYKVTLNSVKTGYQMDCVNCQAFGAYFDTNNTSGVITVYNNASGATGTVTCAAVFPPQTIGTDVNFITVTTTDGTLYYKLPQSVNFVSGQQYAYKLSTYVDKQEMKFGNVICSDGTMCEYSKRGNRTPVAVIAYVGSNTGNSNYCHGLALALSNDGEAKWGTKNVKAHTIQYSTSENIPVEDGNIYRSENNNTSYPAFMAAFNHASTPKNTSGWFLASAYQWQQVIASVGGTATGFHNLLKACGDNTFKPDAYDKHYSTCSEDKTPYNDMCVCVTFRQDVIWINTMYKNTSQKVRAMLAF